MKLELKYLAAYLPYNLKVQKESNNEIMYMGGLSGKDTIEAIQIENAGTDDEMCALLGYGENEPVEDRFKLLLHPMENLNKEIKFDGLWLVPMEVLGKLFKMDIVEYGLISANAENFSSIIETIRYSVLQKILEWHFDVFDLIKNGLAIDINALKQSA